jgi:hypothetical protein
MSLEFASGVVLGEGPVDRFAVAIAPVRLPLPRQRSLSPGGMPPGREGAQGVRGWHHLDGDASRGELLCDGGIAEALDRVTRLMQAHGDRSERRPITATY